MSSESYQLGQKWIGRAEDAWDQIGTELEACERASAAALIASAHFAAAATVEWGDPEVATPSLEPVPDPDGGSAVTYGPWSQPEQE